MVLSLFISLYRDIHNVLYSLHIPEDFLGVFVPDIISCSSIISRALTAFSFSVFKKKEKKKCVLQKPKNKRKDIKNIDFACHKEVLTIMWRKSWPETGSIESGLTDLIYTRKNPVSQGKKDSVLCFRCFWQKSKLLGLNAL